MMSKRMENWDVGDFHDEFRRRAEESEEEAFRAKLGALPTPWSRCPGSS